MAKGGEVGVSLESWGDFLLIIKEHGKWMGNEWEMKNVLYIFYKC